MKIVGVGTADPIVGGVEVAPHTSREWFSAIDKKSNAEDWKAVLSGGMVIYLFVEIKYLVSSRVKITEFCTEITRDFPSLHHCIDHERVMPAS